MGKGGKGISGVKVELSIISLRGLPGLLALQITGGEMGN